MNDELFKQFLKKLDEAPDYVKENTMCYFWRNTSACTKCPKKDFLNTFINRAIKKVEEILKKYIKENWGK